ncbi:hypothetical protein BKG95_02470 [Rodentibacter pneumotropicus]|uniref:Uncharacterized protein n=1 Tax=Rodentibacter pneumotropicus TaxID=758 RepID=A0AAW5LC02_9PAST|nr:hypothetical protein [Rodentibacter pneumotropicus]MCQ9120980.1 hypothetical protein [Rodentibacter pneumotropicus]OOF69150.1 hypothetical protein BKG95_02470 [Rodentibacter pneumotropicus]
MSDILHYCELTDEIKFNITQPIQVQDIVKSLEALEKIVKQSTKTFSSLGKADVTDVKLYIHAIEKGSLLEKIIVKLIFRDEENLNKFLENTHDWVSGQYKGHPVRTSLVGLVIGGMIAYGFYSLGSSSNSIAINGNYNTVITEGASQLNISQDDFKKALEENKSNRKSLAKNAVEFAQPAKTSSGDVSIVFGSSSSDNPQLVIPSAVISDIPKKVEPIKAEEKDTNMDNVTLHIRSLDRDDYNSGWTGYIDGSFTKRVPIEIPLGTDLSVLASKESVKADVTLFYTQRGNSVDQKRIVIKKLNPLNK